MTPSSYRWASEQFASTHLCNFLFVGFAMVTGNNVDCARTVQVSIRNELSPVLSQMLLTVVTFVFLVVSVCALSLVTASAIALGRTSLIQFRVCSACAQTPSIAYKRSAHVFRSALKKLL